MKTPLTTKTIGDIDAPFAMVVLHGLGATAQDLMSIVQLLPQQIQNQTYFVFPQAPNMAITINSGMVMPAWYDIKNDDFNSRVDVNNIEQHIHKLHTILNQLTVNRSSDKVSMLGFSQGAVMALYSGLCFNKSLARLFIHSGYAPNFEHFNNKFHESNKQTPINIEHGVQDNVVPFAQGEAMRDDLQKIGCNVTFSSFQGEHHFSPEAIENIAKGVAK